MTKKTLTASTPYGTFTRKTDSEYKFVVVWNAERCLKAYNERGTRTPTGVAARWVKDRGYGVTWHAKRPTPKNYVWDRSAALLGIFEV